MNPDDFEQRMRALEYFHEALRVLPGVWPVLRLDGRSFSRLTESRFEKPFDVRFHELMCGTTEALVAEAWARLRIHRERRDLAAAPDTSEVFDRSVEKLISIAASIAGGAFSLAVRGTGAIRLPHLGGEPRRPVVDYFRWRRADAARCALNGWAYWTLRKAGRRPSARRPPS